MVIKREKAKLCTMSVVTVASAKPKAMDVRNISISTATMPRTFIREVCT